VEGAVVELQRRGRSHVGSHGAESAQVRKNCHLAKALRIWRATKLSIHAHGDARDGVTGNALICGICGAPLAIDPELFESAEKSVFFPAKQRCGLDKNDSLLRISPRTRVALVDAEQPHRCSTGLHVWFMSSFHERRDP
jgi:hypothetical protein